MTNDMILAAYQQLQKAISEGYEQLEKRLRFSDRFRKILGFVLLFASIVTGSYAMILEKKWYLVILFIIAGFCAAVLSCGILIFLLKPFFYFRRRKAKKLHQSICDKEREQQTLELLLLDNNIPDPIPIEREPLYLKNSNRIRLKTVLSRYRALVQEMGNAKQVLHTCEIKHQKNREWLWFGYALIVLFIAAAIVLALVALYFLVVLIALTILFALVIGWIASQREYYPPVSKPNTNYDPRPERPSLLESIFNATVGAIFAADDASKLALDQAEKDFERLSAEKEELLQLLLPYCPILGELHPQPSQNTSSHNIPPQNISSQNILSSASNPPTKN